MDALNFAKQLRRNQTDAENLIWRELRARRLSGFKFKRQVPLAQYFADFVCFEAKLIIELDGGQDSENPRDVLRDGSLQAMGFTVLRIWNHEVLQNLEGVKLGIAETLATLAPLPNPLPQGERGQSKPHLSLDRRG
jgi:very-short-patch-repair endonuclease